MGVVVSAAIDVHVRGIVRSQGNHKARILINSAGEDFADRVVTGREVLKTLIGGARPEARVGNFRGSGVRVGFGGIVRRVEHSGIGEHC